MSKHSDVAKELFKKGYNCSQAVFAAFCDETGLDFEEAVRLSSSFGGGMGRLREVCGAVSGMFMVAGLKFGYSDPADNTAKMEHYKLIQELAAQFKAENSSIICKELLASGVAHSHPADGEKAEQGAKKRSCADLVELSAKLMDDYISQAGR